MDPLRDLFEAFWPMITCVHGRHVRQQCLGCADVAGGFFPSNVLLARLQCQSEGRPATSIFGDADDSSRHLALESFARCKVGRVRSAITQRDTKSLCAANGDIGAEIPWGTQ